MLILFVGGILSSRTLRSCIKVALLEVANYRTQTFIEKISLQLVKPRQGR